MTWGISGPVFLALYGAVLALLLVGAGWTRRRLEAGPPAQLLATATGPTSNDPEPLDTDEVALLSGGRPLLGAAALLGLQESGALDARRTAVRAGSRAPDAASRVQLRLWQRLHETGPVTPARARLLAAQDPAVDDVRDALVARGFLPTSEEAEAARRWVFVFGVLAVLGLARIVAGIANRRPVGFLVALLIFTLLAMAWASQPPRLTAPGREHLRALRERSSAYRSGGLPGERALAVALFGAAVLWSADAALAETLGMQRASALASGDGVAGIGDAGGCGSGGSDGGGGGSSCGGGCGGGGCGG